MADRSPAQPESHSSPPSEATGALDMEQLVSDHLRAVYGYAFRLSGSADLAEELTQQVFYIAQSRGSQLRQPEKARSWLLTIARNCFFKQQRQRQPLSATDNGLSLEEVAGPVPPADQLDIQRLQAALDGLDEPFRVVLLMFYYEEASYKEIAQALGIPQGTVMSRLARAKAHLRRRLLSHAVPAPRQQVQHGAGEQIDE